MPEDVPKGSPGSQGQGAPPLTLARGSSLGRYLVLDQIGQGGMGVVYAAYDPELDRRVAIKLLRRDVGGAAAGDGRRARLQREAQAMARLSHPNVITVHDVGTSGDQVFVAMELIDGVTLRIWLRDAQRAWREVLDVYVKAGRGLAAAHGAGLIHRDFKQDNVLVGRDGGVRVTDFGLARTAGEDAELPAPSPSPQSPLAKLTETGVVLGTPAYMAPEQHRGGEADARTDQFAFCVALYEALYDEHPFRPQISETNTTLPASSPEAQEDLSSNGALALEVVAGRLRPPRRDSDVPAWVRRAVVRGLSTAPEDRWPDMGELLGALRRDPTITRRRMAGVAGLVLAVAAFGSWTVMRQGGSGAPVCTGAREHLAGVWDAPRRDRVRAAFQASNSPFAEPAFARAAADLDTFADQWTAMHEQACRATRVTGEQSEDLLDRRMACLERRRGELAALTEVLAGADADVVKRAVDAVALLPRVADCARVDALLARVAPADDATAAQVAVLDQRLAEVTALATAGKLAPALDKGKGVIEEARKIGYAPLTARVLLILGRATKVTGDFRAAEALDQEAIALAGTGRDDDVLIEALVELTLLETRFLTNQASARMLALAADAVAARAGLDDLRRARVSLAKADVAYYDGHYAESLPVYQAALGSFEKVYGPDSPSLASVVIDVGDALMDMGKPAEALPYFQRARAIFERAYGPDHPQVGAAHHNLGRAAMAQGKLDDARDHLKLALAIAEKAYGPQHPNYANHSAILGYIELERGNLDEAGRLYQLSYDIRAKSAGPDSMLAMLSMEGVAHVRAAQGKTEEALALYRRVLASKEKQSGPDSPQAAGTLRRIADMLARLHRYPEAIAASERAVAIARKAGGEWRDLARATTNLAQVHIADQHCDWAMPLLREARAIQEKPENADEIEAPTTLAALGECEVREGKAAEGTAHARTALDRMSSIGLSAAILGETRMIVARGLWATGDRRGAVEAAEQAERELASGGGGASETLAETRKWLRGVAKAGGR